MKRKPAEKFQDLIVWQKAHALVLAVYKMTRLFPREELFGLTGCADAERIFIEHPDFVNSVSCVLSPVSCLLDT